MTPVHASTEAGRTVRAMPAQPPEPPGRDRPASSRSTQSEQIVRALLAVAKGAVSGIPLLGGVVAGGLEGVQHLLGERANRQFEQHVEEALRQDRAVLFRRQHEFERRTFEVMAALASLGLTYRPKVLAWLREHGTRVDADELVTVCFEAALRAHCLRTATEYEYGQIRGIKDVRHATQAAALRLDDLFVEPRLVTLAEHDRWLEQEGMARPPPGTEAWGVLAKTRRVVVLGPPGAGKTTLLRRLARAAAMGGDEMRRRLRWGEDLVPVMLNLAEFAASADGSLQVFLDTQMTERGGEALREAIAAERRAGRLLVLLDGVDEVPGVDMRRVLEEVDGFLAGHARCRCVITSRRAGYEPLRGDLPHYMLANFSARQVETFVRKWALAIERVNNPEAPNAGHAGTRALGIYRAVSAERRVAELASNPLMLAIIMLLTAGTGQLRLPQKRVLLYERAVGTLIETWSLGRRPASRRTDAPGIPPERLKLVWRKIAEWMHRAVPGGTVREGELRRELARVLEEEELADRRHLDEAVEGYLLAAVRQTGLLEERGQGIFAFWHSCIQEYLAAAELATPPGDGAVDRLLPYRDDARWREVILLAVGHVALVQNAPQIAGRMVTAIATREPGPFEPVVHGHLLLAIACLADDVDIRVSAATPLIVALVDAVRAKPYRQLQDAFMQVVRGLPDLRPAPRLANALAELLAPDGAPAQAAAQPSGVRLAAARWLGNACDDDEQAWGALRQLMADPDAGVRCEAVLGLTRAGLDVTAAFEAIADVLISYERVVPPVRRLLAVSRREAVIPVLASLVRRDDHGLRLGAARLLRELGHADVAVAEALRPVLRSQSEKLRKQASDLLYELGQRDPAVAERLGAWAHDPDPHERLAAAHVLKRLGKVDDGTRQALRDVLASSRGELWERAAKLLLLEPGAPDPAAVRMVRDELRSGEEEARILAGRLLDELGELDAADAREISPLLAARSVDRRMDGAWLLFQIDSEKDAALRVLKEWLGGDHDLRLRAAQLLVALGRAFPGMEARLEPLLGHADAGVRLGAAKVVLSLDQIDPEVGAAALATLRERLAGGERELRRDAEILLARRDPTDAVTVAAMRDWLRADAHNPRLVAAEWLHRHGHGGPEVATALLFVLDGDEEQRYVAATLLDAVGETRRAVLAMATFAEGRPGPGVAACASVLDGEPLTASDVAALDALVRPAPEDGEARRSARREVFDRIWRSAVNG